MVTKVTRKIVHIDESRCDGCGVCVPSCAEGALQIIEGKAKLVADRLCDGLGACLGHCPQDAIRVEERAAEEFDEQAVHAHLHPKPTPPQPRLSPAPLPQAPGIAPAALPQAPGLAPAHQGGCPGSRMRALRPQMPAAPADSSDQPSRLSHWPVQLALVPPSGPMWKDAHVLIAADCVPFAYPQFHEKMLAGKALAIACPKLDDVQPYIQKLAMIFAANSIQSITVAHMEVPCCTGIVRVVHAALAQAGRYDIPLHDITIGVDGTILAGMN